MDVERLGEELSLRDDLATLARAGDIRRLADSLNAPGGGRIWDPVPRARVKALLLARGKLYRLAVDPAAGVMPPVALARYLLTDPDFPEVTCRPGGQFALLATSLRDAGILDDEDLTALATLGCRPSSRIEELFGQGQEASDADVIAAVNICCPPQFKDPPVPVHVDPDGG